MAEIKNEPLEFDPDRIGAGTELGTGATALVAMESSTSSSCVVMRGRRDLITDNSGGKIEQVRKQQLDDDDKMQIMQEDDPLLQETINALMNGTGGIEVVTGATGVNEESERNHECDFCGKLFTRSNTLSYHLKVHNDEKPYKCGTCDKAFREQYRLNKHQRTHAKDFAGNVLQEQETEHSQESTFPSTSGRTGEEEDYATGDSERFFKSYELQEGNAALKLEPDISLTVDGTSTNPPTQSSSSENDVRYQIIEERIKSLQREVHLVNQNLNRVETKLDGLTKIIAIFINKFEEVEPEPSAHSKTSAVIPVPMVSVPIESLPAIPLTVPPPVQPPAPSQSIQMISHHHPAAAPITTVPLQQVHALQQPLEPIPSSICTPSFVATGGCTPIQTNHGTTVPTSNNSSSTHHNNNDTFPEVPELPIRTVNDFLDLNDHCTDNEQFLLQMMIRLHQEVDSSQPHQRNVKKMMEALVTYEVLCQFSWSGKSAINGQYTKYVFGNSVGIIDLLTKTLNLGRSDEEAEANRKPIFTAIQSFIKHSRQNMLRDSRKRRESSNVYPLVMSCTVDRQMKQIKAEHPEIVNQY